MLRSRWLRTFMTAAAGLSISSSSCINLFGSSDKKKEVKPVTKPKSFIGLFLDKPSRMRLLHALKMEGIEKCDSDVIILRRHPSIDESKAFEPLLNSNCYARIEGILSDGKSKIALANVTLDGKIVNESSPEIPSIIIEKGLNEDEKKIELLPARLHSLGISHSSSHERNLKKFRVYGSEMKADDGPVLPNEDWRGELPPIKLDDVELSRVEASFVMRNDVLRLCGILCTGDEYDKEKDECKVMNDLKRYQIDLMKQQDDDEDDDDDDKQQEASDVKKEAEVKKEEAPYVSPACDTLSSISSIGCSLCRFLKSGPCSSQVSKWEECIHVKKKGDYEMCHDSTIEMSRCMESYCYYDKMNFPPSAFNNYRILDEEYWQFIQQEKKEKK